jgi:xanthine dehydrogenase accessory factor
MNRDLLKIIESETNEGKFGVCCTLIDQSGSTPRGMGASMWVRPDGTISGTIGGGLIEFETIKEALAMLKNGETARTWHKTLDEKGGMACGGEATVYMEVLGREDELVIFGAGHVGKAVAQAGAFAGFRVTVWDERPEFANSKNIPWARTIACPIKEIYENGIRFHNRSYVVICTRGHALDADVVRVTDKQPGAYYGLIGSRSKIATVRKMLLADGVTAEHIDRIHKPIGLPIKAETPEEIAISIMAEIIGVKYGADVDGMRATITPYKPAGPSGSCPA